jgi:Bacterial RNA polymerase, alpha chain C terminal domain
MRARMSSFEFGTHDGYGRTEKIDDLDLSVRSYNCLKREGIHTVGALLARSETDLLDIRNFGQRGVDEVQAALGKLGLGLASRLVRPTSEEVVHEQIDIYHLGSIRVTIHPDRQVNINTSEFSDFEFGDLCTIVDQIRADRKAEIQGVADGAFAAGLLDGEEATP